MSKILLVIGLMLVMSTGVFAQDFKQWEQSNYSLW